MENRRTVASFFKSFQNAFWIANILELFERFAFYGAKAVLIVYLADKLGLKDEAGALSGMFANLVYTLPLIAGVYVDRYGFKITLTFCFLVFCVGYFLIGLAGMSYGQEMMAVVGKRNYIVATLVLTAVGGSLIKPCVVGVVSKTTNAGSQSLGFSIYYTLVNIGGAIGPILAMSVRKNIGIEFVFITSSITTGLMMLSTIFFFKEPKPSDHQPVAHITLKQVFTNMLLVFKNSKFILFLVIFSGFWVMFWQIFYLLPHYTLHVLKYENFELIETVDAICIIGLTIPVSALVRRWKPFRAMIVGVGISSASWLLMGASPTVAFTVAAIGLYSLGEAIQSPRFYEYVSSLAPQNQVGTFMGFAFLPVAIGAQVAGFLADFLRLNYMYSDPRMMWFIVAGIGGVTFALMLLYNCFFNRRHTLIVRQ